MTSHLEEPLTNHFDVNAPIDGENRKVSWEILRSKQDALFHETTLENEKLAARVEELEREVSVWKDGYVKQERRADELQRQVKHPDTTSSSKRGDVQWVACFLNGNRILPREHLSRFSQEAGRVAAAALDDAIRACLHPSAETATRPSVATLKIICIVYLDKKGFEKGLLVPGACDEASLTEFCAGFNTYDTAYSVVWVGSEDSVRKKVRGSLIDWARMPQIHRVICGDLQDNETMSTFQALYEEGISEKFVAFNADVQLAHRLKAALGQASLQSVPRSGPSPVDRGPIANGCRALEAAFPELLESRPSPFAGTATPLEDIQYSIVSPSSAAPQIQEDVETATHEEPPKHEADNSSELSPQIISSGAPEATPELQGSPVFGRAVDPSKPINSQNPHACAFFYLRGPNGCKNGSACDRAHDYALSDEQVRQFRDELAAIPCPNLRFHTTCTREGCFFGHNCKQGAACPKLAKGRCHYKHEGVE